MVARGIDNTGELEVVKDMLKEVAEEQRKEEALATLINIYGLHLG